MGCRGWLGNKVEGTNNRLINTALPRHKGMEAHPLARDHIAHPDITSRLKTDRAPPRIGNLMVAVDIAQLSPNRIKVPGSFGKFGGFGEH